MAVLLSRAAVSAQGAEVPGDFAIVLYDYSVVLGPLGWGESTPENMGGKRFPDFPPEGFKGRTLRRGDPGYAEARKIPNARYGSEPALIAQCLDADDIVAAVKYCDAHDEPIAIRSGGHAIDGHAMPQDAFVIDTTPMKNIAVDPETGVTTVDAGVLLGEMDAATQEHGYVVPAGTVSDTGAAGLTLGGGMGYLTRRFGMTVDSLLSVDVVTVRGERLVASRDRNPELFWGLCGAGHNLAVATAGPSVAIALPCLGGANLDFPEDSTAYSRRGANWMWEVLGLWDTPDKDAEFVRWVDGVMAAMKPLSLRNGYVNLSCDQGPEWLRNLYGSREKWARICALKKAFDPHNRLRYNKNVARAALLQAPASSSWVPSLDNKPRGPR
ncbi:FAD linked oxidase domain protein [Metarhizium robertsii ARSEF 23]|uniref:FAD linked oxidase domain protein n=1 Tax=Metarhizium robertsii (strain ARSEF 23 / ATCC MYA-3075) TaxID=655844 RepID=E9FC79_METRA|nr:FAD linked oxidase domain protein [Metarhizium robertsii ARSEF 23]EFY94657.2 FAD linked oxidase domain protein [Metarhizium robertsii ARSEF 23]